MTSRTPIGASDRYRHNVNGNEYIVSGVAKLKQSSTRKWVSAILYMEFPIKNAGEDTVYVREEEDFRKRFSKVCTTIHSS